MSGGESPGACGWEIPILLKMLFTFLCGDMNMKVCPRCGSGPSNNFGYFTCGSEGLFQSARCKDKQAAEWVDEYGDIEEACRYYFNQTTTIIENQADR